MRTIAPAALATFGKRLGLAQLVEMDLTVQLLITTARDNIDANGKTYLGGNQTEIKVTNQGGQIAGLSFQISGVPNDLLAVALAEPIQGHAVRVYTCLMDPDSLAVLDVQPAWAGTLDQMPISQAGASSTITVTADHRGIAFSRPKGVRYSSADQVALYPGDNSLAQIAAQSTHQDIWPAAAWFQK